MERVVHDYKEEAEHICGGGDIQGDRRNAIQGKMLLKHFSHPAKYRLIKNPKRPLRGEVRRCRWGKCRKHRG